MITTRSLAINAWTVPIIAIGTLAGAKVIPRLPQTVFQNAILMIGAVGALLLVI